MQETTNTRRLTTARAAFIGTGAAVILLNLLADRIGLGEPGSFGLGQVLLVVFGGVLVVIGVLLRAEDVQSGRALGGRIAALYRAGAILLLNTLVVLAVIEMGAFFLSFVLKRLPEPAPEVTDTRAELAAYAEADWRDTYWIEFTESRAVRYEPYVTWRTKPFAGETINVGADGIRRTPGAECVEGAYTVFAFGGSTMWGNGSPDWGTIAAYIQADLAEQHDGPICVVNFGETAFVSTQEVITLMTQLQACNVPDLAIFYDGINDVYAAYQSQRAGAHQNLAQITAHFEGEEIDPPPPLVEWLKTTSVYNVFEQVGLVREPEDAADASTIVDVYSIILRETNLQSLVAPTVDVYLNNYKIVGALAEAYGFEYAFFWQPIISAGDKPLTPEEQVMMETAMSPALADFYAAVYERIEAEAPARARLFYIAGVFDAQEETIWIDFAHVAPEGNRLIAARILDIIGP